MSDDDRVLSLVNSCLTVRIILSLSVCLLDHVTGNGLIGRAEEKSNAESELIMYESLSHRGKHVLARDLKEQFEDVEHGVNVILLFPPKPPFSRTPFLSALAALRMPSPPPFKPVPVVSVYSSVIYTQIACTLISVHAQPAIGVLSVNSVPLFCHTASLFNLLLCFPATSLLSFISFMISLEFRP